MTNAVSFSQPEWQIVAARWLRRGLIGYAKLELKGQSMGSMTVRGCVGLWLFIPVSLSLGADPLDQWQWRNPLPSANPLCEVTYGNGLFVAVGNGEAVMTSPDGIEWTTQHSGSGFYL
jgi:hypothetical protein